MEFVKRPALAATIVLLATGILAAQSDSQKQAPRSPVKAAAPAPAKTPPAASAKAPAKAPAKAIARTAPVPKKPPGAAKSAPGKTTAAAKTNVKGKATKAPPRQSAQMQPTPERYKEIQQSLADKGYFRGPVDGTWGPDSALAMKRFQTEQNLDADGKIGALSLVALGLGPRRGAAKAAGDDPGKPPGPAAETPAAGTPSAGGGLTSAPTSEGAAPAPDTPVQPQQ